MLMPQPRSISLRPRRLMTAAANLVAGDATDRLRRAAGWLPALGATIRFQIEGRPQPVPALGDDYGYRLRLNDDSLLIEAKTEWGGLAALATLCQLGTAATPTVREIADAPRFPWRGLMIDTVRHFISPNTLRRTLDAMWFYKLNVLHLHLTDDQGFRFRSRRLPELASADAYSVEELGALVAYAADRGIRVVPELDVPGHTTSWLTAHPEWGLPGKPAPAPSVRFGVHRNCLDVGNPNALAAVETLLEELADVFPDRFLHIGGDEAVDIADDAQAAFLCRVADKATRLGKRAIGWDECLHPALPKDMLIQAWRGMAARDVALGAGFDCVVSAPYYLDLCYPVDAHYRFHPDGDNAFAEEALLRHPRLAHVSRGLAWMAQFASFPDLSESPDGSRGRVLGGEACLWTELADDDTIHTRIWSRMPALAERFWSGADTNADDVLERLIASRRRLAEMGVVPEDRNAADETPDLAPLLEMLEPVKWYRRLLGNAEFERRVNGLGDSAAERPYDANTPLCRIVDQLAPESLASRRAEADLAAGASMQGWVAGWRQQRRALEKHPHLLGELEEASDALATLAAIVAGESSADPAPLAGPFGEYLLPIAYAVAASR